MPDPLTGQIVPYMIQTNIDPKTGQPSQIMIPLQGGVPRGKLLVVVTPLANFCWKNIFSTPLSSRGAVSLLLIFSFSEIGQKTTTELKKIMNHRVCIKIIV